MNETIADIFDFKIFSIRTGPPELRFAEIIIAQYNLSFQLQMTKYPIRFCVVQLYLLPCKVQFTRDYTG